ncbi:type IX secretion system membrane protein PorP/SprF [Pricia sp.]|uniref:PorP/SprF family type IX secretion system membrane protein n=1 Tax=Pricia sp. TaxID=2268138 RepID=UPI0035930AF4
MKKLILTLVLTITSFSGIKAQQDAQFTQYMYNAITVNPAYAGSRGVLSIAGLYRSQWIGLDGAPKTQTLNVHSPVSERVGLGLSIVNDEIGNGTNQETYFDGVFSYTIPLSRERRLSFGVKAGGHLLNIDFNKLANFNQEAANSGLGNIDQKFSPNFGAGVYYHTESFYAGLSIPNFLNTKHFDDSASSTSFLAEERLNFYMITGYVFNLNQRLKFKPAFLVKAVNGAPLQVDISTNFLLNNTFTLGAAYRWDAALSALFGFQINDKLLLGLAYDRETTALGGTRFNNGSFEILLRYELLTRYRKAMNTRFF